MAEALSVPTARDRASTSDSSTSQSSVIALVRSHVSSKMLVWLLHVALAPLAFWVLLADPALNQLAGNVQVHFWCVSLAALLGLAIAAVVARAAQRHTDSRVFLIALGFIAISGIFLMHSLSTKSMIMSSGQQGFIWSPPVSLFLGSLFLLLSSFRLGDRANNWIMAHQSALLVGLVAGLLAYAAIVVVFPDFIVGGLGLHASNSALPEAMPGESSAATAVQWGIVAVTVVAYLVAAAGYYRAYRRQPSVLLLAILTGLVLFAEADVFMAASSAWHFNWWMYHIVILGAFLMIGYGVWVQYNKREPGAGLFGNIFLRAQLEELHRQLDTMKIEIDELKRTKQVSEITSSDYFQDLLAKKAQMREKREG